MKKIIGTDWCYEAYKEVDDEREYTTGTYSDLADDHDEDTIEWSESRWEDEKDYFMSFFREVVAKYEKRYKTKIEKFALAGTLGLWNGNPRAGKIVTAVRNPLDFMTSVEDVTVHIDDDGLIEIQGHHHDGTHRMNIYLLPNSVVDKLEAMGLDEVEEIEWILDNRKPIKNSQAKGYFTEGE